MLEILLREEGIIKNLLWFDEREVWWPLWGMKEYIFGVGKVRHF
jgi:hypothetical protein